MPYCRKCLVGRSEDKVGDPCATPGCGGVVEETPEFASLIEELPDLMTCGRRFDVWAGTDLFVHGDRGEGQDRWQRFKSNGDRVCSYCGSLHPDDMFEIVRQSAEASEDADYGSVPEIEPSDKFYKIYVRRPGVRNAMEGGIKFYVCHLPRGKDGKVDVPPEREKEYRRAVASSRKRFDRYLAERRFLKEA